VKKYEVIKNSENTKMIVIQSISNNITLFSGVIHAVDVMYTFITCSLLLLRLSLVHTSQNFLKNHPSLYSKT